MAVGRRPSVPHYAHLSIGLLECLNDMAAGFLQNGDPKSKMETATPLMT